MKIELKKIKTIRAMSEETECFIAELWLDGVHRGNVSNRGHGGPDSYDDHKAEMELNAYGKTLPPEPRYGLTMNADLLVGDVLAAELLKKQVAKWCKTHTTFQLPGDPPDVYRRIKGVNPQILDHVRSKYPTAVICNQ